MIEQILVVPREKLFDGAPIPYGFGPPCRTNTGRNNDLDGLIKRIYANAYFIDRPKAENDPSLKQIIPYIMVTYQDKIYTLHRQAKQTEKRLHNKYSIGVGGHINPVPLPEVGYRTSPEAHTSSEKKARPELAVVQGIIEKGLERELHEELSVQCPYEYKLAGYLNDDTNDVGKVHFGMVYRLEVEDEAKVEVAEKDMMAGEFMSAPEIEKLYPTLETWSQLVFTAHKNGLIRPY
jgi:predicted NUDIX family phosphoesterase